MNVPGLLPKRLDALLMLRRTKWLGAREYSDNFKLVVFSKDKLKRVVLECTWLSYPIRSYICLSHFEVRVIVSSHPRLGLLVAHGSVCFQLLVPTDIPRSFRKMGQSHFPSFDQNSQVSTSSEKRHTEGFDSSTWSSCLDSGQRARKILYYCALDESFRCSGYRNLENAKWDYVMLCLYIISCTFDWSYLMDIFRYAMMFHKPLQVAIRGTVLPHVRQPNVHRWKFPAGSPNRALMADTNFSSTT